jgi:hypothetical protein
MEFVSYVGTMITYVNGQYQEEHKNHQTGSMEHSAS